MTSGSLQVKNGKYYAVLNLKDNAGKRKQKWVDTGIESNGNNKRLANKALRDILQEYDDKKVVADKPIFFSDYILAWLEGMKFNIEPNTWESYQYTIDKHIIPYFKKQKVLLQDLEPIHIQKYYTLKLKEGLSPNTIKHHHANIRKSLQDALLQNIIPYNVADRVKLPKINKFNAKFYTANQINTLLEKSKGSIIEPAIFLTAYYGLRRSEILGLKWSAIDFQNKSITISTTVTAMKTILEKERTKNLSSNRTLPLIPEVECYLKKLKAKQSELMLLQGTSYVRNDFVCKWDNGKPLKPDYISRIFKKVLEDNNLPIIRFHDLRHSCASMLSSIGYDIKKIQEWLGHSDITTTANLYTHIEYKAKVTMGEDIAKAIDSVQVS
ncbi:MAG: putative prophage phiRv2 integrase [Firmicutes bacterium ADurb.Bin193]|nr:MAG: putative prophage phiRv2 integrase [Firmicutes bacterium ADurb.Bin193]